ncbi:methyltransferase domain-containing protein [Streptococcus macacae]|uniref:Methyltransferase domain protein n=1 Tax=Streptococcus macacae NCTC 11558 TaxID=764298 RepID=G5JW20_9STRE|nr:methyltransferase domain-containing protein [Streptococcus macacae]EHJ51877.1 methyltransferase domain protein [Streptococcus macacae NCTC 11558]SUN79353.1 Uncharacterised protein [Streptococcus macacae NCTC 11558]
MDKDALIYEKFKKRAQHLTVIDNLYEDETFSDYYKQVVNHDDLLENDISLYKNYFNKQTPVLEIGSGTGRIFNPLFEEGYDIYGLEPSSEMSRYIARRGQNRIYQLTLQDIELLPKNDIEVVIIPATSVSLFSPSDLKSFLKSLLQKQPSIKSIVFDFLKEDFFESSMGVIQTNVIDGKKYYHTNFFDKDKKRIIYNLVNSEKLGISIKYYYSYQIVRAIFEELGMAIHIVTDSENYTMVEGVFHVE